MLSRGLAQAAETMRALPLKLVLRAGISERELALHYGEAVAQLYPLVDPLMSSVLASHLRHATETEMVGAAERHGGVLPGSRQVAVGFADLVGFTRLGEEVPPTSSGAWPRAWKRSRWRWPTRPCGWSRRSATPPCSPRPSPSRCSKRRSA